MTRRVCAHGEVTTHGEIGKDWCAGGMSLGLEPWRAQIEEQMNMDSTPFTRITAPSRQEKVEQAVREGLDEQYIDMEDHREVHGYGFRGAPHNRYMAQTTDDITARREAEGRCTRCGSWPQVCGHGLPLAERMKSIQIDRTSLRT